MKLTIVMYHYVREIENSKYPNLKGLEFAGFKRQLDYLSENYCFIRAEDLVDALTRKKPLPMNPCLLTFDDGYKDHVDYVLPELLRRSLQGSFFPPVKPVVDRALLDVNRVHFVLEKAPSALDLVRDLDSLCLEHGVTSADLEVYRSTYAKASRFDPPEVIYVKRMLQHALPEQIRNACAKSLFSRYVGMDEAEFASELYISQSDAKRLVECGMYVGSHGCGHVWLDKCSREQQQSEIDSSLDFLRSIGAPVRNWIMCYPYGAYSQATLDMLKQRDCAAGLTTEVGFAEVTPERALELARFDTNDFVR